MKQIVIYLGDKFDKAILNVNNYHLNINKKFIIYEIKSKQKQTFGKLLTKI